MEDGIEDAELLRRISLTQDGDAIEILTSRYAYAVRRLARTLGYSAILDMAVDMWRTQLAQDLKYDRAWLGTGSFGSHSFETMRRVCESLDTHLEE